jgi:hypothetical protein
MRARLVLEDEASSINTSVKDELSARADTNSDRGHADQR